LKSEKPVTPESPVDDGKPARRTADKPEKKPSVEVLENIRQKTEWGDFTGLEKILQDLVDEDPDYAVFCNRISSYAKIYEDGAILDYINRPDQ